MADNNKQKNENMINDEDIEKVSGGFAVPGVKLDINSLMLFIKGFLNDPLISQGIEKIEEQIRKHWEEIHSSIHAMGLADCSIDDFINLVKEYLASKKQF